MLGKNTDSVYTVPMISMQHVFFKLSDIFKYFRVQTLRFYRIKDKSKISPLKHLTNKSMGILRCTTRHKINRTIAFKKKSIILMINISEKLFFVTNSFSGKKR